MAERKLKVVQMLPALDSGGVERGTVELASELVRRGHESIVISDDGRMVDDLVESGSTHHCWEVGAKKLSTLLLVPKIRKFLQEEKPDILHLRSRLPAWIGYLAWRGLPESRRPHLVTTVHGPYSVSWYSEIMTKGEVVIAVSESIKEYILNNYPKVDPKRIQVIHRGVDRDIFSYGYTPDSEWLKVWHDENPGLPGKYVVTMPGRLTRWKGQEHFIEVIQRLKQRGIPVHGLIVGGAHDKKQDFEHELKTLVQKAQLTDDVTFTGDRRDLRDIMAISDAVVSLSTKYEAFGRTTIEALSLGIPVAAYAHGGVKEQLADVFPEGMAEVNDISGITGLLESWYHNSPSVPELHKFTLREMLDATINCYAKCVG
ncbi:glycosyltransferase family 4 protein [Solemya velesiana gill symbiont]|uniref:Glycosyl transferase n=1 Tax=Solemya velesiana gill symbiont TaxID=1918948 RepID=A0A1T2KWE4_9GAMM|nr:glycosyltransferase family 4 protein [Solemya velesiana gill symbiont]OOZ37144.1 glycosyl transferase [Solemya velesiana gill symbiont]